MSVVFLSSTSPPDLCTILCPHAIDTHCSVLIWTNMLMCCDHFNPLIIQRKFMRKFYCEICGWQKLMLHSEYYTNNWYIRINCLCSQQMSTWQIYKLALKNFKDAKKISYSHKGYHLGYVWTYDWYVLLWYKKKENKKFIKVIKKLFNIIYKTSIDSMIKSFFTLKNSKNINWKPFEKNWFYFF